MFQSINGRQAPTADFLDSYIDGDDVSGDIETALAFPRDVLPDTFRYFVGDVSRRMCVADDFLAMTLLVVLGSLLGAKLAIQPKRNDTEYIETPNLWLLLVSPSGTRKSPAQKKVCQILEPLERIAAEEYRSVHRSYETDRRVYEVQYKQILSPRRDGDIRAQLLQLTEPVAPKMRRYRTTKSSAEKLVAMLADNERGLLVVRDEVSGLLCQLEQDEYAHAREIYLSGWAGDAPFFDDTIGRGSISARLTISLLGLIQPGRLDRFLRSAQSRFNDGMLSRFIVIAPAEIPYEPVDEAPNDALRETIENVARRFAEEDLSFLGATYDEQRKSYVWKFDRIAYEVFVQFDVEREARARDADSDLVRQHLLKQNKSFCACAAVLQGVHVVTGLSERGPIGVEAAVGAKRICEFAEAHARKVLAPEAAFTPEELAARLIERLRNPRRAPLKQPFGIRQVQQRQWSGLWSATNVRAAVACLVSSGDLREDWTFDGRQGYVLVGEDDDA